MKQNATSEKSHIGLKIQNTFWSLLLPLIFQINILIVNGFNCLPREDFFSVLFTLSTLFSLEKYKCHGYFSFFKLNFKKYFSLTDRMRVKKESHFLSVGIGFCVLFCSMLGCHFFIGKRYFSKWAKHKKHQICCNLTLKKIIFDFYFHNFFLVTDILVIL